MKYGMIGIFIIASCLFAKAQDSTATKLAVRQSFQPTLHPQPLYVVNNVVEIPYDSLKKIDPDKIKFIQVLKDQEAIKQYGEKGRNGVVVIITKDIGNDRPSFSDEFQKSRSKH
ncbi:MAG TPA: hypothetical protein VIN08_08645 [Ohtaekwangia sp.]|uniref:hypothetical protein n=1 Tax=Ohtaekwangia sp. TaxID=2066019 RepID=UPI002F95910C